MIIKKNIKNAFKLIFSFFILFYSIKDLDYKELFENIVNFNLLFFLVMLFLTLINFFIMLSKWKLLINKYEEFSLKKCLFIYWISGFMNLFLLGGVGAEIYKTFFYKNKKKSIIMSILDRILSFWVYFVVALTAFIPYFFNDKKIIFIYYLFSLCVVFIYFKFYNRIIDKLFRSDGLNFLNIIRLNKDTLKKHFALSFLVILNNSLIYWVGFYSFGIKLDFLSLIVLSFLIILFTTLPLSFQGLGVREFFMLKYSYFLNINPSIAIALSLILFLNIFIINLSGFFPFIFIKSKKD